MEIWVCIWYHENSGVTTERTTEVGFELVSQQLIVAVYVSASCQVLFTSLSLIALYKKRNIVFSMFVIKFVSQRAYIFKYSSQLSLHDLSSTFKLPESVRKLNLHLLI